MFRLYLSHLQALKCQIHTIIRIQRIVGSPTLTIKLQYNRNPAYGRATGTNISFVKKMYQKT
jgi:hypothetical protein